MFKITLGPWSAPALEMRHKCAIARASDPLSWTKGKTIAFRHVHVIVAWLGRHLLAIYWAFHVRRNFRASEQLGNSVSAAETISVFVKAWQALSRSSLLNGQLVGSILEIGRTLGSHDCR